MVNPLQRKLIRDLLRMRMQAVAIMLVVACGVASFISMLSAHESLTRSADDYFIHYRQGDVFTHLRRAPNSLRDRLTELPGVTAVETRIVRDVVLDVPGLPEPAVGRLVSLPESRQPTLERLHLRRGRWVDPSRPQEVLVSEAFAETNHLNPGDTLFATLGNRRHRLEIAGIALSPEYIYQLQPGAMWPDDRRFGVLWLGDEAMGASFDMRGSFDDLVIALAPAASIPGTISAVNTILAPYGGQHAYERERQMSARYVAEELKQLQSLAQVMPTMFLLVAAFLLNMVMSRLVSGEREQIATLKAVGYSNARIVAHYGQLVALIASIGAVVGLVLGSALGHSLLHVYSQFFRFPTLDFQIAPSTVFIAIVASLAAGGLGTFGAVKRAVQLPPAEAMRPPSPARYRRSVLEILGLGFFVGPNGRMVLRNLTRRPWRTLSSIVGIAFSVAILVAGNFSQASVDVVMQVQFEQAQRDDLTVTFGTPQSKRALHDLRALPGVLYVEPARDIAVRFHNGHRTYDSAIVGLVADGQLRQIVSPSGRTYRVPKDGLVLDRALAQRLGMAIGDLVEIEVLEGIRRRHKIPLVDLADEMVGMNAYVDLGTLHRLLREGEQVTGARMLIDMNRRDDLYREIKRLPNVAGATLRRSAWAIFEGTTAKMQVVTSAILVLFASVVAIGVTYNDARILLAERSRELASLRVLGFTRFEISSILVGDLLTRVILALPLGSILGYALAKSIVASIDAELYRFPLVILPKTYVMACAVVFLASLAAALFVRRRLDHLDLVEVLKTRD